MRATKALAEGVASQPPGKERAERKVGRRSMVRIRHGDIRGNESFDLLATARCVPARDDSRPNIQMLERSAERRPR